MQEQHNPNVPSSTSIERNNSDSVNDDYYNVIDIELDSISNYSLNEDHDPDDPPERNDGTQNQHQPASISVPNDDASTTSTSIDCIITDSLPIILQAPIFKIVHLSGDKTKVKAKCLRDGCNHEIRGFLKSTSNFLLHLKVSFTLFVSIYSYIEYETYDDRELHFQLVYRLRLY